MKLLCSLYETNKNLVILNNSVNSCLCDSISNGHYFVYYCEELCSTRSRGYDNPDAFFTNWAKIVPLRLESIYNCNLIPWNEYEEELDGIMPSI